MGQFNHLMGWNQQEDHIISGFMADLPIPYFSTVHPELSGCSDGKDRLLSDCVKAVMGEMFLFHQLGPDCVSMGTAGAAIVLGCVQAYLDSTETFDKLVSTEIIYGFSRNLPELGNGMFGSSGGSCGIFGAKFLNRYGLILRQNYEELGIDLTTYDVNKALKYGASLQNCPQNILKYGHDNLVKTISQVRNYNEAADALYSGYPITVCSNVGFDSMTRDSQLFIPRSGSWSHCMLLIGVRNSISRKGLLCLNSWGDFIQGKYAHVDEIPNGAFYIEESTINDMLGQGDSWVFSSLQSYPARNLDLRIV